MIINMQIYFTYTIFIDCWEMIAINAAAKLHCDSLNQLSANTAQF